MLEAVLWKKTKECISVSSKKQELARSIHAGCFTVFHVFHVFQQYAAHGVMACFLCPSSGFLHSTFLLVFQFGVRFQREDSTKKKKHICRFHLSATHSLTLASHDVQKANRYGTNSKQTVILN